MKIVNYHTHTTFCDGKNTPEEIVLTAIEKGFSEIGFSGHSYVKEQGFGMDAFTLEEYKSEINRLKEKYKNRIKIYLGIEQDYYSDIDTSGFDFVIGSVHVIIKDGSCLEIDLCEDSFVSDVKKYFDGNYMEYIKEYYRLVSDLYNKTHCDIIGHFDLVTKFNERDKLFDTSTPEYIKACDNAIDILTTSPVIFEINTGAVARGYRKKPYPAQRIIENIAARGGAFTVSSDCHSAEKLNFMIEANIKELEKRGFICYTSMKEILSKTRGA